MPYSEPTTPSEVPGEVASLLEECDTETLWSIAKYADTLAEYREREARLNEDDEDDSQERPEDLPKNVPTKATLTEKEINGNRYYYW